MKDVIVVFLGGAAIFSGWAGWQLRGDPIGWLSMSAAVTMLAIAFQIPDD